MTPDEYCQDKAAASGSSFYYSFLFLPPERRRAITALYAFCREIDDVVDECHDAQIAATTLSSTAVGRSTAMPRVCTAARVSTVMVMAAPAMLMVAPNGIDTE